MLDLICFDCLISDRSHQYCANLSDMNSNNYQLTLHDMIPKTNIVRLNPFYHDFVKEDNFTRIQVKQKFDFNSQPEIIELESINIYELISGTIITFQDTNTHDVYKMKVNSFGKEVGQIEIFNLHNLNLIIQSMPHYYGRYLIENWIFFNNVIETL